MKDFSSFPQIQVDNSGLELGQRMQQHRDQRELHRAQISHYNEENAKLQREAQRSGAINQLAGLSVKTGPQQAEALAALAAADPKRYEETEKFLYEKSGHQSTLASTILGAKKPEQKGIYKYMFQNVVNGKDPYITEEDLRNAGLTDELHDEDLPKLYAIQQGHRKMEDALKAPQEAASLASTKASTRSTEANTVKTYSDIEKTNLENANTRDEREAAKETGILSPTAAREYNKDIAANKAKKEIALPKVISDAEDSVKLVKDIISHKGLSSMVGQKNIFSGAASTFLPFVDKPIPGTQSANFMAKFEQLGGKQFLEAFNTLKGGGSISEKEGETATKAISSMRLAQSEKEFKKAANDYISVVEKAVARAQGKKYFEPGGMSKAPGQTSKQPAEDPLGLF